METGNKRINLLIREIREEEFALLKDFLYEAIFVPEGAEPPGREVIDLPELRLYIEDFGSRKGDHCLVADFGGEDTDRHRCRCRKRMTRSDSTSSSDSELWTRMNRNISWHVNYSRDLS